MRISDWSSDVCSSDLPGDEYFEAKVTVLSEEIKHHVKEEEKQHDNMFQQARAAEVDLDALGEQLLARKEELKRQAETAGERKSVVKGKSVSGSVAHGGRRIIKKKNKQKNNRRK